MDASGADTVVLRDHTKELLAFANEVVKDVTVHVRLSSPLTLIALTAILTVVECRLNRNRRFFTFVNKSSRNRTKLNSSEKKHKRSRRLSLTERVKLSLGMLSLPFDTISERTDQISIEL